VNWQQVQRLRVLGRGGVPALRDLLERWPQVRWLLDVKQFSAVPALVEILQSTGATDRVCLGGTWQEVLGHARGGLSADVTTALGWRAAASLLAGCAPGTSQARFVHLPFHVCYGRVPSRRLVRRARQRGLRVVVWGATTTAQMQRLLDDGVDGIITDRIDILRETLLSRGQWQAGHPVHAGGPDHDG
jgi:glycerophosphoryl diester phosphodiesterase